MFAAANYPAAIRELLTFERLAELGPGSPRTEFRETLTALRIEALLPKLQDRDMANCCLSGLWLLHDFLDESHALSQEIDTPTGSYWHAIMHRREPDPGNSNYWWRRVGLHPVAELLKVEAAKIGYGFTSPNDFVDFCERVRNSDTAEEQLAKRVQLLEWQLLFSWCWNRA